MDTKNTNICDKAIRTIENIDCSKLSSIVLLMDDGNAVSIDIPSSKLVRNIIEMCLKTKIRDSIVQAKR